MGGSMKIGKIFGIDIKIHFTFLLILGWGALFYGGDGGPLYGLLVTISLFTIVLLHELGHSVAAMFFKIKVKDIILLPIGGVARLERMPEKPWQELVVALAGPAVNVLLIFLIGPILVGLASFETIDFSQQLLFEPGLVNLLVVLLATNIILIVFNMIPAFPLDGGRVFRAILGFFTDYQKATKIAVQVGRLCAIGMGIYGLINLDFFLVLIALFIYVAAGQEQKAVTVRAVLQNYPVSNILTTQNVALTPNTTIQQVAERVAFSQQPNFAVLDPATHRLLGVITNRTIRQAMLGGQWYQQVADVMHQAHHIPVVALHASLAEVQEKLGQTPSKVVAVYDDLDFRGLIDVNDIYRVFQRTAPMQA